MSTQVRRSTPPEEGVLREALALHRAGRLEAAEAAYRRVLARRRSHPFTLQNLGLLLHQRGDFAGAREALGHAAASAPAAPGIRESLGRVLKAQGDLRGARAAFREALRLEPGFADARYQLGTVHQDLEDPEGAAACYRQVLSQEPGHVPAWNSLGSARLDGGDREEAERAFRRALALRPDYVPARLNLAVVLRERGRPDEAGTMLRALVREHPGLFEAQHNLAMVCREQGAPGEAEDAARRALALRPEDPKARHTLAEICLDRSRLGEAAELYRRCLERDPADLEAWTRLAAIHLTHGEVAEGMEAARRALALAPDSPTVFTTLAHAHSVAGEREEAEGWCRRALAADPDLPFAWYTLTQLRRFGDGDRETIARVESIPGRRKLDDTGRANLHFALGRMHHDCRRYDRAFAHFERGNRIARRRREFDAGEWARIVDATIETFGPALFARTRGFGDPTPQPVFVFGMPRSGTSLVEQILASHPAVHGAGELVAMPECVRRAAPGRGPDLPRAAAGVDAGLARRLAAGYLDALRRDCPDALRITDKLPGNYLNLGFIALVLPGAHLVHCRRDPLDVCLSNYMQQYGEGHDYACDLRELGFVYRHYARLMRHWRAVLPLPVHEIAYEDLVGDQERQSRALLRFCGLDWDPACLAYFRHRRAVATASLWQVRRPIYRGALRRWKHYEAHLGALREALGDAAPAR